MSPKWNYILGCVTIGLVIGGTIYAIKKARDAESQEEEAITLEEAKKIVKESEKNISEDKKENKVIAGDVVKPEDVDEYLEKFDINYYDELDKDDGDLEYGDIEEDYDEDYIIPTYTVEPLQDFMYFEEGIDDPKEDTELRFDRNSVDAKHQYIRMELADMEEDFACDAYRIMLQLFEFPFQPTNSGDEVLRSQIVDHKVEFFGFGSKWVNEVSFAEVILHYARRAEFDIGETVDYWINYFMEFNDFMWDSTSEDFDRILMSLNTHTYFNEERHTFGLFGLTREYMDSAIKISQMNADRSVTYEIEFQEFLKSCIQ